jgi:hypothetical protein
MCYKRLQQPFELLLAAKASDDQWCDVDSITSTGVLTPSAVAQYGHAHTLHIILLVR